MLIPSLYAVPVRQVAAGAQHVIALTISGEVFTWGRNKDGRLGLGEEYQNVRVVSTPTKVKKFGEVKEGKCRIKYVAAGSTHTAVIGRGGRLMLCGSNFYGELGHDPYPSSSSQSSSFSSSGGGTRRYFLSSHTFLPVSFFEKMKCRVKLVSLGQNFTAAVTTRGKLFLWGRNDYEQLGIPLSSSRLQLSPSKILPLDDQKNDKKTANHTSEEEIEKGETGQGAGHKPHPNSHSGEEKKEVLSSSSSPPEREERLAKEEEESASVFVHPSLPYAYTPVPFTLDEKTSSSSSSRSEDLFFYFVSCGDFHCGASAVPSAVALSSSSSTAAGGGGRTSAAMAGVRPGSSAGLPSSSVSLTQKGTLVPGEGLLSSSSSYGGGGCDLSGASAFLQVDLLALSVSYWMRSA